ncbi:MAG: flagellar assembly peptidoglycan hydrolase FlgJ [Gammaproteobacteria bacterium]|nr:flagellar assembly peptidoglycan hydrolase FlgJ [Rhodocyclaceae bacterium]MBU3909528.1 flagellar assembly peptidoglycan hydrolase FlgJ [Gammaproteobacteria bacterium]MBU3990089.1 flagellar assembly peptidoglycan hydrolase FlgJ [Gammaproteobacteria bacterium]MBU4003191.1 flagellar assembly peptidoglycan hydrolase FlgJ [Gammaproteobacteria bacterium]MBU4022240.1 flagellar assembly peptidoglycan hydrolase FlgJ [Gammaproteobacteria bacterium]
MNSATPIPSIFDTQSLTALKGDLRKGDAQALKATAQQFEAVFLQMILKSMRAATPQDGIFDSEQTRFYQEMLDSQLSQVMAAKGGMGLAAVIERQLSRPDAVIAPDNEKGMPLLSPGRFMPLEPAQRAFPLPADKAPPLLPIESSPVRPALPPISAAGDGQAQAFVNGVWPHAAAASQQTGIPPHFLVAHAALESGWGRSEPRFADGRPSHNLFGIKAGNNWQGAVVTAPTTEYVNGVAEQRAERFRAYGSYAEAFQDYAQLLAKAPRYAEVVASRDASSFARGLQRAGYATDPLYASKLERIIGGPTLRTALAG